jgi:hypothetical protein
VKVIWKGIVEEPAESVKPAGKGHGDWAAAFGYVVEK